MKKLLRLGLFALLIVQLQACAIRGIMVDPDTPLDTSPENYTPSESFFVTGNTLGSDAVFFEKLATTIKERPSEIKRIVYVGNSVQGNDKATISAHLDPIIELEKSVVVTSYVVPGRYEWKYDKTEGLEHIEDYLEEKLQRDDILAPNNGCALESIEIGEEIQLIIIDSQWYLEDWDTHARINDKCQIKTREKLLLELKGEIKKSANKLVFVVLQHPVFTNGYHGGRFSFRDHIFPLQGNIPLPGVASLIAEIRSQGAVSSQDRFNMRYNEMATALRDILDKPDHRILLISGLEQNLQYIEQGSFKQVISGAASETKPVTISDNGLFSYGSNGFAVIDILTDGSVWAIFYDTASSEKSKELFRRKLFDPVPTPNLTGIPTSFPAFVEASVYEQEAVEKSDFFTSFWGRHYRHVYGTKVKAPVALLDTLYGGLEVVRPGGGNQTKSLRIVTKDNKEYNMRALKKSAVQFLENTAFQGVNGEKYFTNTVPEQLILDFYTAAHPYGAFAIPELAKAAAVFYTTPELYYVPKQKRLGKYNDEYGDQLYMIVERPEEDFANRKSFGYPDDVESTDDLLETLREDEDYILDEEAYIRARIFDMLIGDWDRHSDQWRWAEFENDSGKKVFVPIPRDRDQVFANFDGTFLNVLRKVMGSVNQFGVYGADIKDVKWFNAAGSKLDRALIKRSDKTVWIEQARFIQEAIDDEIVDRAFHNLPKEVQDTTLATIKEQFALRKNNLQDIVARYYAEYIKFQMITGTDKDDHFDIVRLPDGKTHIKAFRIQDGEKGDVLFDRTFNSAETEEIWLYGLDDDDVFEVSGTAQDPMLIRIIGGQNKDTYSISDGKKIKVYDRRSENNDIEQKGGAHFRFTNFYDANLYDYTKVKRKTSTLQLAVANNPDDGTNIGVSIEKKRNDFITNPYGQRAFLRFNYQTITQGIAVDFEKAYAAICRDVNLVLDGRFTSRNYTENFFGFGNETKNRDDSLSLDFNRVNLSYYEGGVGLERASDYGSFFQLKMDVQSVELIRNGNNFLAENSSVLLGSRSYFLIPTATYRYENLDNSFAPTKGMHFSTTVGGIDAFDSNNLTGFAKSKVVFYNSLLSNNRMILKTMANTHLLMGDQPTFYQSPTLGADNGLRGYRAERFTGRHSLAGTGEVSYRFQQMKTFLFPLSFVVYGGVDVGRVWLKNDTSDKWHNAYGGGLRIRWTNAIKANISAFRSDEGVRLEFGFRFTY